MITVDKDTIISGLMKKVGELSAENALKDVVIKQLSEALEEVSSGEKEVTIIEDDEPIKE